MTINHNNIHNKKQNRYIDLYNDVSNNELFYYKDSLNKKQHLSPLDSSNKLIFSNIDNIFNNSILDDDEQEKYHKITPLDFSKKNKSYICKKNELDIDDCILNMDKLIRDTDKFLKDMDKPINYRNVTPLKLYNNTNNSKMNPIIKTNKLISALDDSSFNLYNKTNTNKTDINKTDTTDIDILLKSILKHYDDDYLENYNSPYFSGMDILPSIPEHSPTSKEKIKILIKEKIFIDASVENLLDLINLCDKYPLADNVEYNINMKSLHNIKPSLLELQNMIGMSSIKENIVDQILYFIQDLHNVSTNNGDYMHAVIYGPPGTGKTEVAKIMGKIFSNLGILNKNVFKKVTRDDLVAGYLGQTAIKTKEVIKECIGGVLFIDEAYALGNKEKKDSFSKECIDIICEALSDHKKDLMCIIAGYETELKECFFSYNPGLESRFTWKFNIDEYNSDELKQIFEKMIKECGWKLKEPLTNIWFETNKEYFKFFGRDMEALFSKVKIAHSRRVFGLPIEEKTQISMKDLEKGFDMYKKMGDSEKKKIETERLKQLHNTMYC